MVHEQVDLLPVRVTREAIRAKLLECLASETVSTVRGKIADAVAELARQHTDESNFTRATMHKDTF